MQQRGLALKDPMLLLNGTKELAAAGDVLGRAEKQISARIEGIMEKPQEPFLQICFEINQYIPAGQ